MTLEHGTKQDMDIEGGGGDAKCPLLNEPEPDCYCLNLNSFNIVKAVHFCLKDFRQCPIYRRYIELAEL